MSGEIQIPTAVSGLVRKLEADICMDGATHIIQSVTDIHRLKGRNEQVTQALDSVSGGPKKVMVMGYPTRSAECTYISVYSVAYVDDVNNVLLGGDSRPWPWKTIV